MESLHSLTGGVDADKFCQSWPMPRMWAISSGSDLRC